MAFNRLYPHITALLVLSLFSCKSSQYGSQKKAERLAMNVNESNEVINYALLKKQEIPPAYAMSRGFFDPTPMVGGVVSLATSGIKSMIANEQKKYSAQYSFALNDLYFYDQLSEQSVFDPVGMQFNGFTIVRTFKNKEGNLDTAMTASFEPDLSNPYEIINNSFFHLKLTDIRVDYAKAKLLAKENPKLNMDIEITFYTTYVTQTGQINSNVVLGTFFLPLRDIPMDKNDAAYADYYEKLKGKRLDGQSFIVPRSYSYRMDNRAIVPSYSQGIYSILVRVKESSKNIFTHKLIAGNSDFMIEQTMKGIKANEVSKSLFNEKQKK